MANKTDISLTRNINEILPTGTLPMDSVLKELLDAKIADATDVFLPPNFEFG